MLVSGAQELLPFSSSTLTFTSSCTFLSTFCSSNPFLFFPMRLLSFLPALPLSLSLSHHRPHHFHRHFLFRAISIPLSSSSPKTQKYFPRLAASSASSSHSTLVEHLACEPETNENWDFNNSSDSEAAFDFDKNDGSLDLKHLPALALDVKEQWTRSKLAWLCKELPAHMVGTLVRILTAQRKWMRQADATYVAVHCMRIRESEAGLR